MAQPHQHAQYPGSAVTPYRRRHRRGSGREAVTASSPSIEELAEPSGSGRMTNLSMGLLLDSAGDSLRKGSTHLQLFRAVRHHRSAVGYLGGNAAGSDRFQLLAPFCHVALPVASRESAWDRTPTGRSTAFSPAFAEEPLPLHESTPAPCREVAVAPPPAGEEGKRRA
jgi:hypothetical protein